MRYEVSVLDPGTPVSLDVRSTVHPSLHSCMPNMRRQFSESGGSFSAGERVAFSESHDVHDMRPQVDYDDDPNGPRDPLRSNFDDPDGWEPTEPPGDHFSFPTSVDGQTGEGHHMALLLVAQSSSVVRLGALDRVSPLWWILGTTLGSRQPRAGFVGRPTRDPAHPCAIHCPPVELGEKRNSSQVAFPAMSRHSSRAIRRVKSRLLECSVSSRSMTEIPMTLRAPVCPASRIASLGLLVHVVPSSLQKKQELYPSCTKVSLCPRWMDQEPTPL